MSTGTVSRRGLRARPRPARSASETLPAGRQRARVPGRAASRPRRTTASRRRGRRSCRGWWRRGGRAGRRRGRGSPSAVTRPSSASARRAARSAGVAGRARRSRACRRPSRGSSRAGRPGRRRPGSPVSVEDASPGPLDGARPVGEDPQPVVVDQRPAPARPRSARQRLDPVEVEPQPEHLGVPAEPADDLPEPVVGAGGPGRRCAARSARRRGPGRRARGVAHHHVRPGVDELADAGSARPAPARAGSRRRGSGRRWLRACRAARSGGR